MRKTTTYYLASLSMALITSASAEVDVVVSKNACAHWISTDLAQCLADDSTPTGADCLNAARRDYPRCLQQAKQWQADRSREEDVQLTAALAKEAAKAPKIVGRRFRDVPEGPIMVSVPSGQFVMGTNKSSVGSPAHPVKIGSGFSISSGEITEREWQACFLAGECNSASLQVDPHDRRRTPGEDSKAITAVSWDDARNYARWLSERTGQRYRLPTEAEWEYTARAGTTTDYFWGDRYQIGAANCENLMQSGRDAFDMVMPKAVKSYPANAFGLFDTAGNVAEWVLDCHGTGESGEYVNPTADGGADAACESDRRIVRGGSAWSAASCESHTRQDEMAYERSPVVGFRVVREGEPPKPASVAGTGPDP